MTSFSSVRARAEQRKGGPEALARLLPPAPSKAALIALGDVRILAEMTRRVFSAGFVWSVIEAKWAGFEAAFLNFDPAALAFQPDEFWEGLASDTRIIRNGAKIMAARHNAVFVQDISREHGGFGRFLAEWPSSNQIGLMDLLAKRGSRLGGATGQAFLRFIGWDGFMLSKDVVACLREAGLDIAEEPKSKGDLARIQAQFNAWAEESGLPYRHLSRICAMSAGVNHEPERLMQYMGGGEEE
jgi:3-methyladenine DNA glycosylase Tag